MRRGIALWGVLFAAYAATLGLHAFDSSDYSSAEAHNLLTAESIVSDRDLNLSDEYRTRAWEEWFPGALRPTAGLSNGRLLEPQGIGFPLLIAPAYALGGPTAVELWLAALTALGFVLAAALSRRLVSEPWASRGALVTGLSVPALAASTTVLPAMAAATLLAGAALLALRAREMPRTATVFWCAALVAVLPWLAPKYFVPAAVVAFALWRWLRRRQRGLAGFTALEVVLVSAVVYITVNDRLFGGLTPYAARPPGDRPTGAEDLADYIERVPRLVTLWLDPDVGLLIWAPFVALAFVGIWLLWRSRRERIRIAVPEREDVEVTAIFMALIAGAVFFVAAFIAPALHGPWVVQRELLPALPFASALAGWGLRHTPRAGAALAALTLVASVWFLLGAHLDDSATIAPPSGALPWTGRS